MVPFNSKYAAKPLSKVFSLNGLIAACLLVTLFSLGHIFAARESKRSLHAEIEFNGINFGAFDDFSGLDDLLIGNIVEGDEDLEAKDLQLKSFSLKRHFITQPSLYSWINASAEKRMKPTDIEVYLKTPQGDIVNHYTLLLSKPKNWSLKVSEKAAGGYFEAVDFTVYGVKVNSL